MPSCSIKHVVVKWHTKGSGRFSFIIWLQNPTSKMWLQVAYVEGDRVHLYPKQVAWKCNIPTTGPQRESNVVAMCVKWRTKEGAHCIFVRSVMLVCASWTVLKDGIHKWMYEWVTWATKVNSKITVYMMYSLPKNHSFLAFSVNKWICN